MEELNNEMNFEEMVEHVDASELEVFENLDDLECSDNVIGKIVIGAVAGVVGLGALAFAKRDKIRDWRIKRWEKKGYKVEKIEPVVEEAVETVEVETTEVEKTEVKTETKKKKNK